MAETVPCSECARPNASHKVRCLYCGAAMPNPTARPIQKGPRPVPEDLDALVKNALRTGKLRDLSAALHTSPTEAPAASGTEDPEDGTTDPGQAPVVEAVPPGEALLAVLQQVEALRQASGAEDALALLSRAPALLEDLGVLVTQEAADQSRVPVELPPIHFAWMLLVAPWGDRVDLAALSRAAGLDQATLRMQGRHSFAQVLARSDDREDLAARAARTSDLGLVATVVARETLARIDAPRVLLRRDPDGTWFATRSPLWQVQESFDPAAPPPGEPCEAVQVTMVVPSDVVVRRFRQSSDSGRMGRKRDAAARAVGESRIGVLDLHGPGTFLRVVEGITDLASLPGAVPGSSRRSLVGLQENLGELFPGVQVVGKRVCQSADGAPSIIGGEALARTGWPRFEEHTRLLRVAALGKEA